jgi:hypothetical protein
MKLVDEVWIQASTIYTQTYRKLMVRTFHELLHRFFQSRVPLSRLPLDTLQRYAYMSFITYHLVARSDALTKKDLNVYLLEDMTLFVKEMILPYLTESTIHTYTAAKDAILWIGLQLSLFSSTTHQLLMSSLRTYYGDIQDAKLNQIVATSKTSVFTLEQQSIQFFIHLSGKAFYGCRTRLWVLDSLS